MLKRGGGCIFYHSKISLYTKIPEWTGAVFYHKSLYTNTTDWTDAVIYVSLQYYIIRDLMGAVFVYYNTAI